jgi:hypothetical protein
MKKIVVLLGLCIGLFLSCQKNNDDTTILSITGKAQKGPFITGTNITLNELNSKLGQTGKSFTTSIIADDGSFSLRDMELNSSMALLTANGYYFSEIYGELSGATLTLQAISDLSKNETVNINVFTHIIKERVLNLVSAGLSFSQANRQAKDELYSFLNVTEAFDTDFENMDITGDKEQNAVLLAFSVILQRYTMMMNERAGLTAELTQLLVNLSADFSADGAISNQALIDALLYNISQVNLIHVRNKIEKKYEAMGQTVIIPQFEKYIAKFQEKHSKNLYTEFTYPELASPEPTISPDSKLPNLLVPGDTLFYKENAYSMAAIIPLNASLTIKVKGSGIGSGGIISGWEFINEFPEGFTLRSQRYNELMTMLVHFSTDHGQATIEYYENDAAEPSFVKKIRWECGSCNHIEEEK